MNEILRQIGDVVVDKFYRLDLESDDFVFGTELQDGMIVLADVPYRHERDSFNVQHIEDYVLDVRNRWCEVTKRMTLDNDGNIAFIAVYIDGQKVARRSTKDQGWLVKKNVVTPKDSGEGWDTMDKTKQSTFAKYQAGGGKYGVGTPRDLTIDDTK